MTPGEIIAIMQLVAVLEPQAVLLVNKMIETFEKSDKSPEERMKDLKDLQAKLHPMTPIV